MNSIWSETRCIDGGRIFCYGNINYFYDL